MNNLFKGWKNMTPEEKKTEKTAMVMMGIVVCIVLGLILIACCSHG